MIDLSPRHASSRTDAISLLRSDHARLASLFDTFEHVKDNTRKKAYLAKLICLEVKLHTMVEEQIFYPVAAAAIGDPDLLDEDSEGHAFGKHLTDELDGMTPDDPQFDLKVNTLGKYFTHHGDRESREIFPRVVQAGIDLKDLAERILRRKSELVGRKERVLARQIMFNLGMKA